MKKVLLSLFFALAAMNGWAQGIMGKWITEAGDAQVEIYQQGDKINGKIVWLQQGPETKDKWEGGKIYNPKNGKTYKCTIWLEGNNLKVRGYLGIFYETQTWKRGH